MSPIDDDEDIPGRLPGHEDAGPQDDQGEHRPSAEAAQVQTMARPADPAGPAVDPVFRPSDDGGFSPGMKAAAVLGSIFAPFISVVVALVMLGSETNPVRRAFLKAWAGITGGLLVLWIIVVISVASSFSHSGPGTDGPCIGGPIIGASGEQVGPHRWRFPCAGGGSTVVNLP